MSVTIYLVRPELASSPGSVRQCDEAGKWVEVAQELASLAEDEERARKIGQVWLRLYMRRPRVLYIEDMDEMLALLDGLELKLVGPVVDEKWRVRPEQLTELRARTTMLDLDESRGGAELGAVGEAMYGIVVLRDIFATARRDGLLVAVN